MSCVIDCPHCNGEGLAAGCAECDDGMYYYDPSEDFENAFDMEDDF